MNEVDWEANTKPTTHWKRRRKLPWEHRACSSFKVFALAWPGQCPHPPMAGSHIPFSEWLPWPPIWRDLSPPLCHITLLPCLYSIHHSLKWYYGSTCLAPNSSARISAVGSQKLCVFCTVASSGPRTVPNMKLMHKRKFGWTNNDTGLSHEE